MAASKNDLAELRIHHGDEEANRTGGRRWIILLLLLAVAVVAAWSYLHGRPVAVRTQAAKAVPSEGGLHTVLNASGYVVARRQATVSSKITGKVIEVLIEEGMKVKEGQVLARLDDSNVSASLELAKAQVAAYQAALAETRARLEEADKEFRRVSNLVSNRVASAADFDHADAEVKSLRARLESQVSQVAVAERERAVWQQQLEDTVIRAPFTGMTVSKNAQPGEMISPISAGGGFTRTGIGTIVDMASLEIEVDVNESFLHRVQPGQPVEARLDAYPDWKIPCQVFAIIPTADRQKATVKVRVRFNELDPRILPDMGAKVAFQGKTDAKDAEVIVPKIALRKDDGHNVVWVVQEGKLQRRAVTINLEKGAEVTVAGGVIAGDAVVVEGPERLAEGMAVQEKK